MNDRRPTDRRDDTALDAERIVDAAMALTRRHGLQGFSMRRLADDLGVTAMAPYSYFPSKEALLDAVTHQVFAQVKVPSHDGLEPPWDEQLRTFAWAVHDVLVEYPGVADQIYTYQRFPASAVPLVDHGVRLLQQAGFDETQAVVAFDVLASVVITRTHFESHQRLVAGPDEDIDDRIRRGWHRLDDDLDERVPVARHYVDHLDRSPGSVVFARAVDVVLRGLAAELSS